MVSLKKIPLAFLLFLLPLLSTSCGGGPEIAVYVESTINTNGGRPLYIAVKYMEEQEYIRTTYQSVAKKMFKEKTQKEFLTTEVIYPGEYKTIEIKLDENNKKPLGVFFIFLNPGDKWKTLIPQPLPSSWEIELGNDAIKERSLRMILSKEK